MAPKIAPLAANNRAVAAIGRRARCSPGGFVEVTLAVLVFEDMIEILLLAVLTAVASAGDMSPSELGLMIAGAAAYLGPIGKYQPLLPAAGPGGAGGYAAGR